MRFHSRAGVVVCLLSVAAQAHAPSIGLSRIYLNFTVPAGGSSPLPQSVTLTNTTHGRMAWTATVSTNGGGNWLSVSPSAGLLPGFNVYEWAALGVAVSPSSLPAGVYYGTITIRAPGDALSPPADNTPQLIEVALTVGSAGPAPGIGLSPSALSLDAVAGATVSAAIQVRNTGGGTLSWTATQETSTGGNWLSVAPSSGGTGATISVLGRAAGLNPGTYTGRVTFTASGAANSPQSAAVTLRVTAPAAPSMRLTPASLIFDAPVGTQSPPAQRIDVSNAGAGVLSWRASATTFNGGPWLAVAPASGTAPAAMTISADLADLPAGTYAGRITVSAEGVANSPVEIPVTFAVRRPQPVFDNRGVVHSATFLPAFLAAGQILTIFGANLGPREGVAFTLDPATRRLPLALAGTSVTFDGFPAPLFYVRDNQINLQVPFELAGRASTRMVVRVEGFDPAETTLPLREASPGVFTMDGTRAAALNENFSLNVPQNPVERGSFVQLFLTGQGALDPPVESGELAPLSAPFPAAVLPVTVTMDGVPARVLFAGAAPGYAGLLQLNVEVPRAVAASDQVGVTVLVGSHPAGKRVTISVR